MGTGSCIRIKFEGEIVFSAILNHAGGIYNDPPDGVGDHVLEFLRDQTLYERLKSSAHLLDPFDCEEDQNDRWIQSNFGQYATDVLDPLQMKLLRGKKLKVPYVNAPMSYVEYYYVIDLDENNISIRCDPNEPQVFAIGSLPGSYEIVARIERPSGRVQVDSPKFARVQDHFEDIRRQLNNLPRGS